MVWVNSDGLRVRFPSDDRGVVNGGEYPGAGEHRVIEVEINLPDVGTSATILSHDIVVPRNSFIEQVELLAETALGGFTALDVGLIRLDATTELDYDGLIDGAPVADFAAAGNRVTYIQGSDEHGALIGTETAYPGLVTALRTGSAGTGRAVLRIKLYVKDADTLVQF
jgi:hypothetical protein